MALATILASAVTLEGEEERFATRASSIIPHSSAHSSDDGSSSARGLRRFLHDYGLPQQECYRRGLCSGKSAIATISIACLLSNWPFNLEPTKSPELGSWTLLRPVSILSKLPAPASTPGFMRLRLHASLQASSFFCPCRPRLRRPLQPPLSAPTRDPSDLGFRLRKRILRQPRPPSREIVQKHFPVTFSLSLPHDCYINLWVVREKRDGAVMTAFFPSLSSYARLERQATAGSRVSSGLLRTPCIGHGLRTPLDFPPRLRLPAVPASLGRSQPPDSSGLPASATASGLPASASASACEKENFWLGLP